MTEVLLEKEKDKESDKELDIKNSFSKLKSSIKSNMIKNLLFEEDLEFKNKKVIEQRLKSNKKTKNKNDSKNKSKIISNKDKINKIKKNKENKNELNNQIIIQKIKPKSRTINNLMNEDKNKNILKTIKKKPITKNKIDTTIKSFLNINKNKKKSINKNYINNKKKKLTTNNITNISKLSTNENIVKLAKTNKIRTKYFSPQNKKSKIYLNTEPTKTSKKIYSNSETKNQTERIKPKIKIENELNINNKQNNKIKLNKKPQNNNENSILSEINENIDIIINPNNTFTEKTIQDFSSFLESHKNFEENPKIKNTLDLFKKGNKYMKKYIHLPIYHHYSNEEIVKNLLFNDILSFLLPHERYFFAKTNRESLIKYMKMKGIETEYLLDHYNLQKDNIEKKLNKNQNIKITKNNFFNNNKLLQIFKLLNDVIYLEIFNDKTKIPNDNIIFVYKLFFLLIKNTDSLIQLNNNAFWEKICDYFIKHTNEFNQSDLLLGDLIKKIMQQKLNFSDENLKKIYEIVNQIDKRQIKPITFSKISPTTSQFCYIIEYYLEFFGIVENEWNPLENEYIMLQYKIKNLIKKINKIGLYIVNLKYKKESH